MVCIAAMMMGWKRRMNGLQEMAHRLNVLLGRITDWMLIGIGAALIVKALLSVDVPLARYVIMGLGVLLVGSGLWYRHRRKRRCRGGDISTSFDR
jgi:sulfite exporter TauE/SafE